MRYIKFLILAIFLFLSMIFFFQNQAPLSQQMVLTLNLFFIPAMTSIPMPFYFLLIASFLVGALLCWFMLIWDRVSISAKYHKANWKVSGLQKKVDELSSQVSENKARIAAYEEEKSQQMANLVKASQKEEAEAAEHDAEIAEHGKVGLDKA